MKKIFGLFAAAVLAATGLTCCGGGGGGDSSFAYKTIEITSPISNVGKMYIRVTDPIPEAPGTYVARYGFGADKGDHPGTFKVESQSETGAEIYYYVNNYEAMTRDANAIGFYGNLIEDVENRDNQNAAVDVDFPFMTVKLTFAEGSTTSGSCAFTCMLPVPDDITPEERLNLGIGLLDRYYMVELTGTKATFTIFQH